MSAARLHLLAEFATPEAMTAAAARLAEAGYGAVTEAYSPFPVEGAFAPLGLRRSPMSIIVALGGLVGVCTAYLLQWWCNAVDYRINVGGRPEHAMPSFIPVTFELGVLFAGFGAFFGLWAVLGLPRPHHPVFELERFRSASCDRYWVGVVTDDPERDRDEVARLLRASGASHVDEVVEADGQYLTGVAP